MLAVLWPAAPAAAENGPVLVNASDRTFELQPDPSTGALAPMVLTLVPAAGGSSTFRAEFAAPGQGRIVLRPGSSLQFPRLAPGAEEQIAWFEVFQENAHVHADVGVLCYQSYLSLSRTPTLRLSGFFFKGSAPAGCRFTGPSGVALRLENAPPAPPGAVGSCPIL